MAKKDVESKAPSSPGDYQKFLQGLKKAQQEGADESQQKKTTGQSQRTPGNGVLVFLVLIGFCMMSMAAIFLLQLIK